MRESTLSSRAPRRAAPWHSIRVRLPVLIAGLLALAVLALGAGAHQAVRRALIEAAGVRIEVAGERIADLLEQSAAVRVAETSAVAGASPLREYSLHREADGLPAVEDELRAFLADPRVLEVELWSERGELLFAQRAKEAPREWRGPPSRAPAGAGPGPLRSSERMLFYDVVAELAAPEAPEDSAGRLVVRRSLSTAGSADAITGLIGSRARLLLGNRDGSLWSDLESEVPAPPADLAAARGTGRTVAVDPRGEWLGAALPVDGAPWSLWLEIPQAAALEPAGLVLRQLILLSGAVLIVGAVVAYLLAGGISRPLAQLTEAAEELATVRVDRAIPTGRRDELGRLAQAFERMRQRVTEAQQSLEARVGRRTKELEDFSYTVSHDLRAPLRAIDGVARMLEEDYGESLDMEARRLLGGIRERALHMGKLIDGLLRYSKLSREAREDVEVAMEPLAQAAAAALRAKMGEANGELVVGPLPSARGDARLLSQVWQIYLDNAVKFSAGTVGQRIEVGGHREGTEAVYWVRDNGVGFEPEYADKLFVAFERLHSAETFGGAGIGLALAERMVRNHGGRVWAEGRPGEGATFYFALPVDGGGGLAAGGEGS